MLDVYKLGDPCWIALGSDEMSHGSLVPGRVVAELTIPNHPTRYYIIETEHAAHPYLEIRDALLMSRTAETFPGFSGAPIPPDLVTHVGKLLASDVDTGMEDDGTYFDDDGASNVSH